MENRQYFRPKANKVYTNKNGSQYRCLSADGFDAEMIHTTSKWRFKALGCQMYDDGKIKWNGSENGYFDEKAEKTKKTYLVSFRHSKNVHCTNIVITDDTAKIGEEYSEYKWYTFRECADWELDSYKRRGMPIIKHSRKGYIKNEWRC